MSAHHARCCAQGHAPWAGVGGLLRTCPLLYKWYCRGPGLGPEPSKHSPKAQASAHTDSTRRPFAAVLCCAGLCACARAVFMGMGEPLLNLPSVVEAYHLLNKSMGIGGAFITISTVGVPNAIARLAEANIKATLAVSLHAPSQALREALVPSAKVYPLDALMADCAAYWRTTGRRVTFEYTLLQGLNDELEHVSARLAAGLWLPAPCLAQAHAPACMGMGMGAFVGEEQTCVVVLGWSVNSGA